MRDLVCIYTRVQYVSRYMYAGGGGYENDEKLFGILHLH